MSKLILLLTAMGAAAVTAAAMGVMILTRRCPACGRRFPTLDDTVHHHRYGCR